jgi:hypothetical protein
MSLAAAHQRAMPAFDHVMPEEIAEPLIGTG